jgi:hypothetical protein
MRLDKTVAPRYSRPLTCGYFLYGFKKNSFIQCQDVYQLLEGITVNVAAATLKMLQQTWQEI